MKRQRRPLLRPAGHEGGRVAYPNGVEPEPRELIVAIGNAHLYRNHLDEAKEQIQRKPYPFPRLKIVGDVPWSKMSYDTDIARAMTQMYDQFNIPHGEPAQYATILGGYWPSYLFSNQEVGQRVAPVSMPIGMGGAGHGGGAHAANEFYVIEGAGKVYGMAGAEKAQAAIFYNFAAMNGGSAARKTN